MRLYITEKPRLAKALCRALGAPIVQHTGYMQCGEDYVTSCHGHLVELAAPEFYDASFARWDIATLPLFPEHWQWTPCKNTQEQLRVVDRLIKLSDEIVHVGPPDREGQLLIDSVLRYSGVNPHQIHTEETSTSSASISSDSEKPRVIKRLLLNDLTAAAIQEKLTHLEDNHRFRSLCFSAIARQKSDWLYGINLSRLITLLSRVHGGSGVFSVGRVQTPVLGLIIRRDEEIAQFAPQEHVLIQGTLTSSDSTLQSLQVFWTPPAPSKSTRSKPQQKKTSQKAYQEAADVLESVYGQSGLVTQVELSEHRLPPPLPYDLSSLQIDAAECYGLHASVTQRIAQELFETYHLISFPRTDNRHLPLTYQQRAPETISTIALNLPELLPQCNDTDSGLESAAWKNLKSTSQHGIIPTLQEHKVDELSENFRQVYELICRRFLLQFLPEHHFSQLNFTISIGAGIHKNEFSGQIQTVRQPGWLGESLRSTNDQTHLTTHSIVDEKSFLAVQNQLQKEMRVTLTDWQILTPKTQPPMHYTDATLIEAMSHIREHVTDPLLRKTLRDADGFGTEATRAHLIETLYQREYISRNVNAITATEKGRALVAQLPQSMSRPDMTAVWEARLNTISSGTETCEHFLSAIRVDIGKLMTSVILLAAENAAESVAPPPQTSASMATSKILNATSAPPTIEASPQCPVCHRPTLLCLGKYGVFWSCKRYPQCKGKRPFKDLLPRQEDDTDISKKLPFGGVAVKKSNDMSPAAAMAAQTTKVEVVIPCPECHSPLQRRTGKFGVFWGCSNYPKCTCRMKERDGNPDIRTYLFGKK